MLHAEPIMISLRLILVSVIWGVNFAFVKFALSDFHPLSFTVVRFSLGALFLMGVMLVAGEPFGIARKDRAPFVRLGLIGITLYNIFFMEGLKYTTASHSALLISLSPLFAALIQAASGKERITGAVGTGLLLSSIGVFLIIRSHSNGLDFSSGGLIGDVLTLFASVFWALYTLKAKPLLEAYSPVKVTAYTMATGSLLLLPVGMYEIIHQTWSAISAPSWAALGFAAFVSGGLAFSLWYQGVKRIGVTRTIVYHYLVPFVAVVFAAIFLDERISSLQVLGGLSILTGVSLVQRSRIV